jgi:hypothetical protein
MITGRPCGAIDQHAEIELALDLQAFFDQHAADDATFGARLVRDERHADHLLRETLRFGGRLASLTPPPLPRPPAMNLGLDDHDIPAEPLGDGRSILRIGCHLAARNGYTEPCED